jgi:LmbE family N-acetylglucosaminyl deacetylase
MEVDVFDHNDQGTKETRWAAERRLAGANVLPPPAAGDHLVVVAAHPDDETLGAGGLIATAAQHGALVEVIVATDGEASHPASPTHTPEQLATRRRAEVISAMLSLHGTATVIQMGLPDGLLDHHRATLEEVIGQTLRPASLLLTPWFGDRHPDHEACARAAQNALRRRAYAEHWQYPIWAWHWADPSSAPWQWDTVARLELNSNARAAKQAAIACHRSQDQPLSDLEGDEAILSESFLEHFRRPYETFLLESSPGVRGDANSKAGAAA